MGFQVFAWPDLKPKVIEDNTYGNFKIVFEKFIYLPIYYYIKQNQIEKFVYYFFNYFSDKKIF